jgi:hypothetical protein
VSGGKGPRLVEGVDYTLEDGLMVFTPHYLLRRGYCCNSGCRNCPYTKEIAVDLRVRIVGGEPSEPEE